MDLGGPSGRLIVTAPKEVNAMQAGPNPADLLAPQAGGEPHGGFRFAHIGRLQHLEGGTYWPKLQPYFLNPSFKLLRYQIDECSRRGRPPERPLSIRGASGIGELDIAYIADRLAATLTVTGQGISGYCLTSVSRGALECTGAPGSHAPLQITDRTGLIYRGEPGTRLSATANHERLAIWIPTESLHRRLSALLGGPVPKDLVFQPASRWDLPAAQSLRRLLRPAVDELASPAPFAGSDVASRSFVDLSLYTILRSVPHNYSERLARAGSPALPAILRRADAYIRAHVEKPITLHDVAEIAGCSVRTLQLGFRRFRDTTPLAAIQQARLEAAREALRSAEPGSTVTAVAIRFGFSNPGRFASLYKAAFGESPLGDLRGGRSRRGHAG